MPTTSMRRPGRNRASRSVTRRSGSSGPAAAAVWVAIWRLLYLTDLISNINRNDINFPGKAPRRTRRDGADYRTDGHWWDLAAQRPMIRKMDGMILAAGDSANRVRPDKIGRFRAIGLAASRAVCVPVTCPVEWGVTAIKEGGGGAGHGDQRRPDHDPPGHGGPVPPASQDPEASTLASARGSPGACETQPGPPQACTAREATEAAARSPSNPGPDDRRSWGRSLIHAGVAALDAAVHDADRLAPQDRPAAVTGLTGGRRCHDLLSHDAQPPVTAIRGRGAETAAGRKRPAIRRRVRGARTAHLTHHQEVGPATTGVWSSDVVITGR